MMTITTEVLIRAYCAGVFPMARERDSQELLWFSPEERGIIPLDGFHVPKRLARTVRQNIFDMRYDHDFRGVMRACAELTDMREDTWINSEILRLYGELHDLGVAHSVECWQEGELVGGLYGVALGGAFFGESMFSRKTDASKVALVHLVARLRLGRYVLLDTQFVTDHLRRFGATEVPRPDYLEMLEAALAVRGIFYSEAAPSGWAAALDSVLTQSATQIS
ncbi:MAG: leucyl/phenylalanyl-tRNA--protein transferase [Magnetospiraceae bacterium]